MWARTGKNYGNRGWLGVICLEPEHRASGETLGKHDYLQLSSSGLQGCAIL